MRRGIKRIASSSAVSHVLLADMPIEAGVARVLAMEATGRSATPFIWLIRFWHTPTGTVEGSVTAIIFGRGNSIGENC
jgi:hypothetical protein